MSGEYQPLDRNISTKHRWMVGGKKTGVIRQSQVRGGMVRPGERPRLNQGLSRHHRTQVEGFKGSMCKVP